MLRRLAPLGVLLGIVLAATPPARANPVVFSDTFTGPDRLLTNEYADAHPGDATAAQSSRWTMGSGSAFVRGGMAWTGRPDGCKVDRTSAACNDSAVFRMRTKRTNFGDVTVGTTLRQEDYTSTPRTPATSYDGVHLWLRYKSEFQLYAASVQRRDGRIVIKKKCPGGPSNGGTYLTLASAKGHPAVPGVRRRVGASAQDNPDGSVTLRLGLGDRWVLTTTDHGKGCAPLTGAGAVGIRGDNDQFAFDDFRVGAL